MDRRADHFTAPDEPETTWIGPAQYVSVRGEGPPGTEAFYTRKSLVETAAHELRRIRSDPAWTPGDITEIAYWYDDVHGDIGIANFYSSVALEYLHFRMLVQIPDEVTNDHLDIAWRNLPDAVRTAGIKPELYRTPGRMVVQVMHHGPFANEFDTLHRLGEFAARSHLERSGPHHELHLDPFSHGSSQEQLRTILRDPVTPVGL
ncbi:GyrI-like domain-containing protein [Saccharopolyspora sp. ID03-671]|uniref:hypothetical protein n=1 Tax=Saccharopolyspora sp. ID03-671 TaxID=3073066 RepID=UPI00324B183F